MNKKILIVIGSLIVIIFFLLCVIGILTILLLTRGKTPATTKQGTGNPPHYGVYVKQSGDLIELEEQDLYGVPRIDQVDNVVVIQGPKPVIVYWRSNANLNYLQFYQLSQYNSKQVEMKYNVAPKENGIVEITPSTSLKAGTYCFMQGDLISAFTPGWCFQIR